MDSSSSLMRIQEWTYLKKLFAKETKYFIFSKKVILNKDILFLTIVEFLNVHF